MGKKKSLLGKNELLFLPNKDKLFHESWEPDDDMLNFPHPSRFVITGKPGCGKTNFIKNLIIKQDPPWEEIYLLHCDAEYTKEYDDLGDGVIILNEIPAPTEWEGRRKSLVILDDLEYKCMSKDQKRHLDRLFGYVSTHKNISIMITAQDCFNLPPIVRRCANVFVLWKSHDLENMRMISKRCGLTKEDFSYIFKHLITDQRDCLVIDCTEKTQYPLRKNGYQILKIKSDDNI